MVKVSFIMPFYNGAATVIPALDSIYEMSLPLNDFEVIIVDDCSPVSAESVLSVYSKNHKNMCIVRHDKNTRQGGAKNTGIALANGKYIAFIDQDDKIVPTNMEIAVQKAYDLGVDVIACHYYIHEVNGNIKEVGVDYPDKQIVSGKEYCEEYYNVHDSIGPWSYLYRKEYVHNLNRPMKEYVLLEDVDWTIWHLIHALSVSFLPLPIYSWCMNPFSITHSTNYYSNMADCIKAGYRKICDAKQYRNISPLFADKIIQDGRWNVIGGFQRLWKIDDYKKFYKRLDCVLKDMQSMEWPGRTSIMIMHPRLSVMILSVVGPVMKIMRKVWHLIALLHKNPY